MKKVFINFGKFHFSLTIIFWIIPLTLSPSYSFSSCIFLEVSLRIISQAQSTENWMFFLKPGMAAFQQCSKLVDWMSLRSKMGDAWGVSERLRMKGYLRESMKFLEQPLLYSLSWLMKFSGHILSRCYRCSSSMGNGCIKEIGIRGNSRL